MYILSVYDQNATERWCFTMEPLFITVQVWVTQQPSRVTRDLHVLGTLVRPALSLSRGIHTRFPANVSVNDSVNHILESIHLVYCLVIMS